MDNGYELKKAGVREAMKHRYDADNDNKSGYDKYQAFIADNKQEFKDIYGEPVAPADFERVLSEALADVISSDEESVKQLLQSIELLDPAGIYNTDGTQDSELDRYKTVLDLIQAQLVPTIMYKLGIEE
jgi:hypothetical protein